jgi:cytochrome c oxidase subunit IV
MTEQHAHIEGHTGEKHEHPNYMRVFWGLVILTAIEVFVAQAMTHGALLIVILVGLALVKAALVAQYFMHLKYDIKLLSVIGYIPIVLLAILLGILAMEWAFQPKWLF